MPRSAKLRPQNFNPPHRCGGKNCYPSRLDAEQVVAEKAILQPEITLSIYHCLTCRSWHLTRDKQRLENFRNTML